MPEATATISTGDRVLLMTRIFDAPRHLVFDAWAKPEHLTRWFGPTDFTVPSCAMDFRVGGHYRYCMHAPDGQDHWVWGDYREIVPPDRLVFTWDRVDPDGTPRSNSVVTLTFEDFWGKTKMTLRQERFALQADCDEHSVGWSECLDKLAAYVSILNEEH